jgi:hypothetical protein
MFDKRSGRKMRKIVLLNYILIVSNIISTCWSQNITSYYITNPQDTFHFSAKKKTFLFVCPTDEVNTDSVFLDKVYDLVKSDKRLKSAEIHLLFYKPTFSVKKYNALRILGLDSTIKINGILQCFAINFPCERIDSTVQRVMLKNKYWYKNYSYAVTEALISPNIMCPQNLGERLYFYDDFMKELISPKYSEKEEIEFLKSRITDLEIELLKIQEQIKKSVPVENSPPPFIDGEIKKKKKFNWFKK